MWKGCNKKICVCKLWGGWEGKGMGCIKEEKIFIGIKIRCSGRLNFW